MAKEIMKIIFDTDKNLDKSVYQWLTTYPRKKSDVVIFALALLKAANQDYSPGCVSLYPHRVDDNSVVLELTTGFNCEKAGSKEDKIVEQDRDTVMLKNIVDSLEAFGC